MKYYLMTSGTHQDDGYFFLGSSPEPFWEAYSKSISFENHSFVLESDGKVWKLCIPSVHTIRRDFTGRVNRCMLVFSGACADTSENRQTLGLLNQWLEDRAAAKDQYEMDSLGKQLDQTFSKEWVDSHHRKSGKAGSKGNIDYIDAKLREICSSYHEFKPSSHSLDGSLSYYGAFTDKTARQQCMARASELVLSQGKGGLAAFINLTSSEKGITKFTDRALKNGRFQGCVTFLVENPEQHFEGLWRIPANPVPNGNATERSGKGARENTDTVLAIVVIAALLVIALIISMSSSRPAIATDESPKPGRNDREKSGSGTEETMSKNDTEQEKHTSTVGAGGEQ
ncbi:MAG: hypothetical protein PHQ23_07250 [Candidatus Wallbacteria bacterium]|nr:hypothetical protein [Candidatus Wallbacteria bacterium]